MYQHFKTQNDRNKDKFIVMEVTVKSSPIHSKWHWNLGHPEIILSVNNGKLKSTGKEKHKSTITRVNGTVKTCIIFP